MAKFDDFSHHNFCSKQKCLHFRHLHLTICQYFYYNHGWQGMFIIAYQAFFFFFQEIPFNVWVFFKQILINANWKWKLWTSSSFKGYRIYSSFKFIVKQRKIVVLIAVKLKTDHADNLTAGHKKILLLILYFSVIILENSHLQFIIALRSYQQVCRSHQANR